MAEPKFHGIINYEDPYVQPLILSGLKSRLPASSYKLVENISELPSSDSPLLQFRAYESIEFEHALQSPHSLINAYIIRKALIRKHYLSNTVASWTTKHQDSILRKHVKPAVDFELDYAEFLDDALVEAFELRESFERNADKEPADREWWILKPGMSDRGQGIRLFSTEEELTEIFEEWEAERPDSDDEYEDSDDEDAAEAKKPSDDDEKGGDYIITSQLRHFIAQPYIHPPLLLSPPGQDPAPRKFHIRTYVLAAGALRVYVYRPMLALFAAKPYTAPWAVSTADDLKAHLTNTCLQDTGDREGSVCAFWDLPSSLSSSATAGSEKDWKQDTFDRICKITGETFEAAARGQSIHFQPLPNAFELFGLDFMLDEQRTPYLLEVNAFPDFRQTGDDLKGLVGGLFEEVVSKEIAPFFGVDMQEKDEERQGLVKVLDIDLGRR